MNKAAIYILLIINCTFIIPKCVYCQSISDKQKINDKVKENDEEDVKFKIENYYNELNNFTDDNIYTTSNARNNRAEIIILNFFLNNNVTVRNDLDQTNSTESTFKIKEYLKNIKVFLNDSILHFEPEIKYVKTFFHDAGKNKNDSSYIFIKAEVYRKLERTSQLNKVTHNNADLDFLFYKKPDDNLYIYSITKHENDTNLLKKVIIDKDMPSYVTGKIYIKTKTPNVEVTLNNFYDYTLQNSGILPYYKTGTYKMKISKEKYYEKDTIIIIRPDKTDTVNIGELKPKLSHIVFNITPPNAEIYVNNEKINYNNNVSTLLFQGLLNIEIKAEHYNTLKFESYLDDHEINITRKLKPRLGHLTIFNGNEYAMNSSVYIDDINSGNIPANKLDIVEGLHTVKIKKGNCEFERKLRISENEDTVIVVRLVSERKISFITDPSGAEVFIDNVNIGKSNLHIKVDIGLHKIRISKKYYNDINDTINLKCNSEDTIERWYSMKLNQYNYVIKTEIKDADIYINKDLRGKTPDTMNFAFGKYKIKIKSQGRRYKTGIRVPLKNPLRKFPLYPLGNLSLVEVNYNPDFTGMSPNYNTENQTLINKDVNKNFQASFIKYGYCGLYFSLAAIYPFSYNNKLYTPVSLVCTDPEFKVGGSIVRKIDFCAIAQGIYAKNPANFSNGNKSYDGDILSYYAGAELRTRFTRRDLINFFVRYGYQKNYINFKVDNYKSFITPVSDKIYGRYMFTAGITLMTFGNNEMLRMWYKPIFNRF